MSSGRCFSAGGASERLRPTPPPAKRDRIGTLAWRCALYTRWALHAASATIRGMTSQRIILRAATSDDESFAIEMARHACVIEDRPRADSDDDEVIEALPPAEAAPIIALYRS